MARIFDKYWTKTSIVEQMKARAMRYRDIFPPPTEHEGLKIVDNCHAQYEKPGLTTSLIFTMDSGMHSVGWWKNPFYERCYHLSLSFWYPNGTVAPKNDKETKEWVELFFYPHANWVWVEPPFWEVGKKKGVWHYRLFADEHWVPFLPKGEVYSKEFTELGWKSWSELQYELEKQRKAIEERI